MKTKFIWRAGSLLAIASTCWAGAMLLKGASPEAAQAKARARRVTRTHRAAEKPSPAPARASTLPRALSGRLVFSAERNGNTDIYMMKADGTGLQRLTTHPGRDLSPAISTRGEIAFVSERDTDEDADSTDDNAHLYVMAADGSGQRRVVINRAAPDDAELGSDPLDEDDPSWSPDGKRLAFIQNSRQVRVVNADGSGLRTLPVRAETAHMVGPRWSPDGKRLLCLAEDGSDVAIRTGEVISLSAEGGAQKTIATKAFGPSWSPDGQRVVFGSIEMGSAFENDAYEGATLRTVPAGGGKPRILVHAQKGYFFWNPIWSPDGRRVAFVRSTTRGNPKEEASAIFIVGTRGGKLRRVPNSEGAEGIAFVP